MRHCFYFVVSLIQFLLVQGGDFNSDVFYQIRSTTTAVYNKSGKFKNIIKSGCNIIKSGCLAILQVTFSKWISSFIETEFSLFYEGTFLTFTLEIRLYLAYLVENFTLVTNMHILATTIAVAIRKKACQILPLLVCCL
jgi:hypothetical protein